MKERSNPDNNKPAEPPPNVVPLRERIEKRAYHLWLTSGAGHGEHLNHWLQAEGEVLKAIRHEQGQRCAVQQGATVRKTKPAAKQRSSSTTNEAIPNQ